MSDSPHDALELRIAEAIASGEPLPPDLAAHAADCDGCATIVRALRDLDAELAATEPDDLAWRRFDAGLRERLRSEGAVLPGTSAEAGSRSRFFRWGLPLAATFAAMALVLWALQQGESTPEPRAVATGSSSVAPATVEGVLAAASEDSLELGMRSWGLSTAESDEVPETSSQSALLVSAPAPAWGDILTEVEEDLSRLTASEQDELAQALREAT